MEKNLNNPQNPNADYFFFYLYPLHLFDSKAGRLQSARHPASLPTWPETPPQTSLQHCAPPLCYNTLLLFLAHAVHARGSDGHQNVLWSISYSHVVREQVKSKKPGVFPKPKQNNPQTQTQTSKHATEEDTQKSK